jgi:hypothetical protein
MLWDNLRAKFYIGRQCLLRQNCDHARPCSRCNFGRRLDGLPPQTGDKQHQSLRIKSSKVRIDFCFVCCLVASDALCSRQVNMMTMVNAEEDSSRSTASCDSPMCLSQCFNLKQLIIIVPTPPLSPIACFVFALCPSSSQSIRLLLLSVFYQHF